MFRMLRYLPALLLVGGLAFALVACGSSTSAGSDQGSGGATTVTKFAEGVADQKVEVSADPSGSMKWTKQMYMVTAGDVTFVVKNPSVVIHNFVVEGPGVKATSANIKANGTLNATLRDLKPGEYKIVCTIPGHREAGMVATLVVK
jgi:uncharacterized cupredoxin-like copper-binding protein